MREFSKQNQELLRQALEEAQAELIKKFEIIREARTRPREPIIRADDTEMKLAELSFILQKEEQQKEQQLLLADRKEKMQKEKQRREEQLQEAIETIELHRKVNIKAATIRSAKKLMWLNLKQRNAFISPFYDGKQTTQEGRGAETQVVDSAESR